MGKTVPYIKEWMNESIPYGKFASMDGVGKITYEDEVNLDCYVHGMLTKVVNDKGEEIVSMEQVYLDGSDDTAAAVDFGDRFKLHGRYKQVKSIDRFYDEDGDLDLVVIYL